MEIAQELRQSFEVDDISPPKSDRVVSVIDYEEVLRITADTLIVRLSPGKAVLFQKISAPFTERDLKLRRRILDLYPRNRSVAISISSSREPKFEILKEKK